jgi:hypothetical protein
MYARGVPGLRFRRQYGAWRGMNPRQVQVSRNSLRNAGIVEAVSAIGSVPMVRTGGLYL